MERIVKSRSVCATTKNPYNIGVYGFNGKGCLMVKGILLAVAYMGAVLFLFSFKLVNPV